MNNYKEYDLFWKLKPAVSLYYDSEIVTFNASKDNSDNNVGYYQDDNTIVWGGYFLDSNLGVGSRNTIKYTTDNFNTITTLTNGIYLNDSINTTNKNILLFEQTTISYNPYTYNFKIYKSTGDILTKQLVFEKTVTASILTTFQSKWISLNQNAYGLCLYYKNHSTNITTGYIFYSIDNGQTFAETQNDTLLSFMPDPFYDFLVFNNSTYIYATRDGKIYNINSDFSLEELSVLYNSQPVESYLMTGADVILIGKDSKLIQPGSFRINNQTIPQWSTYNLIEINKNALYSTNLQASTSFSNDYLRLNENYYLLFDTFQDDGRYNKFKIQNAETKKCRQIIIKAPNGIEFSSITDPFRTVLVDNNKIDIYLSTTTGTVLKTTIPDITAIWN